MSGATRCPKCGYEWVAFSAQEAASRVCLACRARPVLAMSEPAKRARLNEASETVTSKPQWRAMAMLSLVVCAAALMLFVLIGVVALGTTLAFGRFSRPAAVAVAVAPEVDVPVEEVVAKPVLPESAPIKEVPPVTAVQAELANQDTVEKPAAPSFARLDDPAPEPQCSSARHGTSIEFVNSPTDAAKQALLERKLVFVLHISGNFEEAKFT